jgi:hypothetical protein
MLTDSVHKVHLRDHLIFSSQFGLCDHPVLPYRSDLNNYSYMLQSSIRMSNNDRVNILTVNVIGSKKLNKNANDADFYPLIIAVITDA